MDFLRARFSRSTYQYTALPDETNRGAIQTKSKVWTDRNRSILKLAIGGLVAAVVLYFVGGYM